MGNDEIEIKIKTSIKAKKLRITVYRDMRVVVTVPRRLPTAYVHKFITMKRAWIIKQVQAIKNSPKVEFPEAAKNYRAQKEHARRLLTARLEELNKFYGFSFNRVSIRNQKSRWGSCSKKRNLNFNFRLAFLPDGVRDYVIVHELCHLQELNHSKNFWALVSRVVPDYKKIRKQLNTFSLN